MRKNKWASVIVALVCMAVLIFTGCDKIESVKKAISSDADILDSAYFYDEDTNVYRTAVIVQNNTSNPIENGFVVAKAYDENGERINNVMDSGAEQPLMGSYNWLCKGEKTAVLFTNEGFADDEEFDFMNLQSHYTEIPATLEWGNDSGSRQDPDLLPHGLSVTAVEPYYDSEVWFEGDYGEYMATIHNDSETDYTFDENYFGFDAGDKLFGFDIVAVYRDSEGKICDMQDLQYTGIYGMPDLPAGSDTELYFFAEHAVEDESLTPEYYISITDITDKAGE